MEPSNSPGINSQPEDVHATDTFVIDDAVKVLYENVVDTKRDLYASYIGNDSTLAYMAIAANESIGRMRSNMMQNFTQAGRTDMATIAAELAEAILSGTSTAFDIETSVIFESDKSETDVDEIIHIDSETDVIQSSNYQTAYTNFDKEALINPGTTASTTWPCHDNIHDTSNSGPGAPKCIPAQSIPYQTDKAANNGEQDGEKVSNEDLLSVEQQDAPVPQPDQDQEEQQDAPVPQLDQDQEEQQDAPVPQPDQDEAANNGEQDGEDVSDEDLLYEEQQYAPVPQPDEDEAANNGVQDGEDVSDEDLLHEEQQYAPVPQPDQDEAANNGEQDEEEVSDEDMLYEEQQDAPVPQPDQDEATNNGEQDGEEVSDEDLLYEEQKNAPVPQPDQDEADNNGEQDGEEVSDEDLLYEEQQDAPVPQPDQDQEGN